MGLALEVPHYSTLCRRAAIARIELPREAEGPVHLVIDSTGMKVFHFAKHTGRVGYFGRLRVGRSIGSGAVEGLARRPGRRLEVPGRGWEVGNLDGMASLVVTIDTMEWAVLWARPAA